MALFDPMLFYPILGAIVVIAALICICRCCVPKSPAVKPARERGDAKERRDAREGLTENLIPPVFYTEGMQDPLHQADLSESVRTYI
jgi:hypothetical protein